MARYMTTMLVLCLGVTVGHARTVTLVSTDFAASDQPVADQPGVALDRTTGALPWGWREESSWARVWTDYEQRGEEEGGYLRVKVSKIERDWCQFVQQLPSFGQEATCRLTLRGRSLEGQPLHIGVRVRNVPYTYLWDTSVPLKTGWQDFRYDFKLPREEGEVGLYLRVEKVGSVDLKSVKLEWTDAPEAPTRVPIDTDFGTAATPVAEVGNSTGRATGVLPQGWQDDSSWAKVWMDYQPLEEEGRRYLHMQVTKVEDGRCQLRHALEDIKEETFFRLSLTARSSKAGSVELQIRDAGAPYKTVWSVRPALVPGWKDFNYDFRLTKYAPAVGFFICLDGTATLDIQKLKLTQLTRADYIAELNAKYAEGGPRNLLRISRLPLGLQSGWTLDRDNSDGDDVLIAGDPETIGPSGAPAMKISTAEPTRIYSAPFAVPLAFRPHTASLYVKTAEKVRLTVLAAGPTVGDKTVQPEGKGEWERIEVTFTPQLMVPSYTLKLEVNGNAWVDALQVEPGTHAGPYTSAAACEVSLTCPESDASMARVQFEDEPTVVQYCVTGAAPGASLKMRLVNVYGEQKDLTPVVLGTATLHQGTLNYGAFATHPFGPQRIEAWVEDPTGKVVSTYNELVINRLRRPRYWGKDAPDSPFGVHTNSTTRHNLMAKACGINWTRLHDAGLQYLGWYHLEPEPGKWTFHDKEIYRYRRDHIKVLGELGTAPFWASYYPGKAHSGYFDRFYQPKKLEDYANYVRVVTQRYKGIIDAYDVWNEPWIWAWWGVGYDEGKTDREGYVTSKEPQADFARLMETAYRNAKATDPGIRILGFNSTTGGSGSRSFGGSEWTRGVLKAGGLDFCDAICYHNYIGGRSCYPEDVVEKGFKTATGPIQEQFGKLPKPVWMTEGSAGRDTVGPGFYRLTIPYDNNEDLFETGDRVCRQIVSLLSAGVEKTFVYSMHGHSYLGNKAEWRVIVNEDGQLHPSGCAYSAMAWLLEDTKFVERLEVAEGVYAYLFAGAGRAVAAISCGPSSATWKLPTSAGVSATDLFGNPVAPGSTFSGHLTYLTAGTADELQTVLGGR